jgi:hypothetical protein
VQDGTNEEHGEVALLEVRRLLLNYADIRGAVLDSRDIGTSFARISRSLYFVKKMDKIVT